MNPSGKLSYDWKNLLKGVFMSWLLFLDESGHDHRTMPYEIHGGVAIHAKNLWAFISQLRELERSIFGDNLHAYGTELKGSKLLNTQRFEWEKQDQRMDDITRRKHALNFLNNSRQNRKPRRDEFTAYGQACIAMAEKTFQLLDEYGAKLFAAAIPCKIEPSALNDDYLRKDIVFLLERYFYFLESQKETGLLVMDGSEKQADRKLARRMERYFTQTITGKQRTQWIVPTPLFVESDMAYGVQVADMCIYCLNWGWRSAEMSEPTRKEIVPFVWLLEKIIWSGDGWRDGKTFKTQGVVFVPDPYSRR